MKKIITLISPEGKRIPMLVENGYVPKKGFRIECEECMRDEVKDVVEESPIKIVKEKVVKKVKKITKKS